MNYLSKNFTLEELVKSSTALRRGINNTPNEQEVTNLTRLTRMVLQPVRDHFGSFTVSSGFRSTELNDAIGGSETSQHCTGAAADFEVVGLSNFELANWLMLNLIEYDQLVLEYHDQSDPNSGWVHCSVVENGNRNEVLTINKQSIKRGLPIES